MVLNPIQFVPMMYVTENMYNIPLYSFLKWKIYKYILQTEFLNYFPQIKYYACDVFEDHDPAFPAICRYICSCSCSQVRVLTPAATHRSTVYVIVLIYERHLIPLISGGHIPITNNTQ